MQELGSVGEQRFRKWSKLKRSDWIYHFPRFSDLILQAGGQPNNLNERTPSEDNYIEYAKVCFRQTERFWLGELETQIDYFFKAFVDMEKAINQTKHDMKEMQTAWYSVQMLLVTMGNVSKLFQKCPLNDVADIAIDIETVAD